MIPGSRKKSFEEQKKLLARYSQKAEMTYEVPHILEAAVSIFMEYIRTGNRLYGDNPWSYTRCQERVSKCPQWRFLNIAFPHNGLCISSYCLDDESSGLGGMRQLKSISDSTITTSSISPPNPMPAPLKPPSLNDR